MAQKKTQKKKGGEKKYGRNKRPVNSAMSAYIRGKISFESYLKQSKSVRDSMMRNPEKRKQGTGQSK